MFLSNAGWVKEFPFLHFPFGLSNDQRGDRRNESGMACLPM
jgi:hypothetical protein